MIDEKMLKDYEISIRNTKTKYCNQILEVLYEHPNIRQVDIANELKMPASNLQSIMKKLLKAEPSLILEVNGEGKTKLFALSMGAEEYMQSLQHNHLKVPDGETPFQKWVKLVGYNESKSKLYSFLNGETELSLEERRIFEELIYSIRWGKESETKVLENEMEEGQLFNALQAFIDRKDRVRIAVEPLCQLYKEEWKAALGLVDYVFEYCIFDDRDEIYQIYKAFNLETEESYMHIKWALLEFIRQTKDVAGKKERIYQEIERNMADYGPLAFYIAEKIFSGGGKIIGSVVGDSKVNEK